MKAYLLGSAFALATMVATVPAVSHTFVQMGPGDLSSSNTQVTAGNDPTNTTDPSNQAIFASNQFDIYGVFTVDNALTAESASTVLEGMAGLSNLTAAVYQYTSAGGGTLGTKVATLNAVLSNSTAWVFQSPVAFALAPGKYALEVTGNKGQGAVLQYELSVTAVPLPGAAMMFGAGLLVIGGLAARRKQVTAQAI